MQYLANTEFRKIPRKRGKCTEARKFRDPRKDSTPVVVIDNDVVIACSWS